MPRENPLFFKKDGTMDLWQFLLACLFLWVMILFTLHGLNIMRFGTAAFSFLGSFVVVVSIAWAARDRADLIANARSVGEVARGIAEAPAELAHMFGDERDD
jgi:hypothetical protein